MKVWVNKNILLENVKSLPFKAWVGTFNVWVPGDIQCRPGADWAYVRFRPFEGFGEAEARVPLDAVNVDKRFSTGLIKGGLPIRKYDTIRHVLKVGHEEVT